MVYNGFVRQTAIALASKFNSHLLGLSSDLDKEEGSFDYDYSFLSENELCRVLSIASYELGFSYQFSYSKKEPGKLFYKRNGQEKPPTWKDVLVALFYAIITTTIIVILTYPIISIFFRRINEQI
jgi:hypothetical protein